MKRHALSDEEWKVLRIALPRPRGRRAIRGDRAFINAVLWRARTGAPWRDLPPHFGPWKTVYNRFASWAKRGLWEDVFRVMQFEIDDEGVILDGSVVRAHQDAAGGKGGIRCHALGRSRGGFSTKLHAIVDTRGRPIEVRITPGQQHEATVAQTLLDFAPGRLVIADLGYDSDPLRGAIRERGLLPVIPSHPNRKRKRKYDRSAYRVRYLVEVFFHNLKRFRAIATRYDKTHTNFLALINLACAWLWIRQPTS